MRIRIYAGQYFDEKSGLHYNYNRYYDPKTGRYLTPYPIGLAGRINLFSYAENNPINLVDPWGLRAGSAVRPGTRGLDPSAHPVFQPGTYENQLISNDLNRLTWIIDPVPLLRDSSYFLFEGGLGYWVYDKCNLEARRDNIDYEKEKIKFKLSNKYEPPKNQDPKKNPPPPITPTIEQQLKRESIWAKIWRVLTSQFSGI